jgi:hypothetical protein
LEAATQVLAPVLVALIVKLMVPPGATVDGLALTSDSEALF